VDDYSYARYLSAKKTVDDRALNRRVVDCIRREIARIPAERPYVVEFGPGLGATVPRLIEWDVLRVADYLFVDIDAALLKDAESWLSSWARGAGYTVERDSESLHIRGTGVDFRVRFAEADAATFDEDAIPGAADLLVANAFLDLVELPQTLDMLMALVRPGGLCWLSVNYDGETMFIPEHASDDVFMQTYNRSMDDRVRNGRPSGDSKTGRHLFGHLQTVGVDVLEAGASDWVVHATSNGYQAEEAHFLHHIVHTVNEELQKHAQISSGALSDWSRLRHAQIDRQELVLIAHQLDFAGRRLA
jgi:hypothetical protein